MASDQVDDHNNDHDNAASSSSAPATPSYTASGLPFDPATTPSKIVIETANARVYVEPVFRPDNPTVADGVKVRVDGPQKSTTVTTNDLEGTYEVQETVSPYSESNENDDDLPDHIKDLLKFAQEPTDDEQEVFDEVIEQVEHVADTADQYDNGLESVQEAATLPAQPVSDQTLQGNAIMETVVQEKPAQQEAAQQQPQDQSQNQDNSSGDVAGQDSYTFNDVEQIDVQADDHLIAALDDIRTDLMGDLASPSVIEQGGADSVLYKICAEKLEYVKERKSKIYEHKLLEKIPLLPPARPFAEAITLKTMNQQVALIAEVKKASPSKGVIREDFDPVSIATAYERAGATCLSVLTDEDYFCGSNSDLIAVRQHVDLPIIRKDFIVDPYQVTESRAIGADCILLIMAAVTLENAMEIEDKARSLGMDVLVEIHDEQDLEKALKLNTTLIGINNRNLKTLQVDLNTTLALAPKIPSHYTVVCESGIATNEDILRVGYAGVFAFLVGESLMRQDDIEFATRQLLGAR